MAATGVRSAWRQYRSIPIVYRIGAAFVLGSAVGLLVGEPATALQPLGDLFVRLLSMIVIFTLLMGVRQLSLADLGKVGGQVGRSMRSPPRSPSVSGSRLRTSSIPGPDCS
jgi:uncharacterized membrane protein YfcA